MIAANLQHEHTRKTRHKDFLRAARKPGDAVFVTPEELEPDGPEFPEDVPPVQGTDVTGLFPSGTSLEMMADYARTTGAFSMIMLISPDAPRPVPGRLNDDGRESLPSAGCGAPNNAGATPQLDALRFMPRRSTGATGTWWWLH